ncbi:MAG TPA: M20/M25/M40 family metallo-hydrolase [Miltoncostaeaceae bacterium]|nr:M20/M25/M40 family metallo-hydrolase [Miltoncostaeaceae bacterium]
MRIELLTRLAEAHGAPGREAEVAAIVRPELEAACARVETDPLGGLLGHRPPDGDDGDPLRLMLAAHMDEVGLMVTAVEDSGYVRFIPLGGWDARTLVSQTVRVHGREPLAGVVGTPPVHVLDQEARNRAPKLQDLVIDVGLPAERVRELVRAGDVVTRTRRLERLGDLLTGKSMDDRVGVFVMLEALRQAGPSRAHVVAAATVQEEVGLRGARVAAARVRPHVGLAIDTCPSGDGPGVRGPGGTTLGRGAAIRVMDASAIGATVLVELLERIARDRGIPHQFHVSDKGGTDTQSLQLSGEGAIAGCVSIPQRYGHSSVEAVHPDDVRACIDLVAGLIETVHELAPGATG